MIFYYSNTKGLVKHNLKLFFAGKARGYEGLEALEFMLNSWFPKELHVAASIYNKFILISMGESQKDVLRSAIWLVFLKQNGMPLDTEKWMEKYYGWFEKIYPRVHVDYTGYLPKDEEYF